MSLAVMVQLPSAENTMPCCETSPIGAVYTFPVSSPILSVPPRILGQASLLRAYTCTQFENTQLPRLPWSLDATWPMRCEASWIGLPFPSWIKCQEETDDSCLLVCPLCSCPVVQQAHEHENKNYMPKTVKQQTEGSKPLEQYLITFSTSQWAAYLQTSG